MNYVKEILKGVLIGIANIIPGVSGGTMAVSMGIYDKIIGSITNIFKQFKKSIMTLLPYVIGMGLGIVGLAYIIRYLFDVCPLQTSLTFIGLILGGLPILLKKTKGKKIGFSGGFVFILMFAFIVIMQMIGDSGREIALTLTPGQIVMLFIVGVIASATMVIPGVSGSMFLMILGYYNPIIDTITGFFTALSGGDMQGVLSRLGVLVPFGIGVVIGIFAIAELIELLLTKWETITYCGILGLVTASPVAILMNTNMDKVNFLSVITGVIMLMAGLVTAYTLGREK